MLIRPGENLQLLLHQAWVGGIHLIVIGVVVGLGVKGRGFMRIAFWVMMPILLAMYLVLGVIGEIRVFAEVFPVVWFQVSGSKLIRSRIEQWKLKIKR